MLRQLFQNFMGWLKLNPGPPQTEAPAKTVFSSWPKPMPIDRMNGQVAGTTFAFLNFDAVILVLKTSPNHRHRVQ